MPAAFTSAQLDELGKAGDARLALAAAAARDGQVIQFLAGAPELLARYRNAPPAAAALIGAAMDARRLGMGAGLPRTFLEAAVPGYLTEAEWDALGEDWLEQALAYAAVPCKGVPGPLTRIRPRPPRSRPARPASRDGGEQPLAGPTGPTGGPVYRLADYLDQHGRQHRKSQIPPAEFWAAAADHVAPADQAALGDAADARGLYRDAAQLHKNAAAAGNLRAASYLSGRLPCLRDDARPVRWAVAHAVLDDPDAVAELLRKLRKAGAQDQATALLRPRSCRPRLPRRPRSAWPGCWTACGRRARRTRPPRCWTVTLPPASPSTTHAAWPSCWGSCGRRARRTRSPCWPAAPLRTSPSPTRSA